MGNGFGTSLPKDKPVISSRGHTGSIWESELQGRGNARQILATTPALIASPEQSFDEEHVETHDCDAEVRDLGPDARQLFLSAPTISAGQTISATAHYKITVYKQFQNYQRDQFPQEQKVPRQSARPGPGAEPRYPLKQGSA